MLNLTKNVLFVWTASLQWTPLRQETDAFLQRNSVHNVCFKFNSKQPQATLQRRCLLATIRTYLQKAVAEFILHGLSS